MINNRNGNFVQHNRLTEFHGQNSKHLLYIFSFSVHFDFACSIYAVLFAIFVHREEIFFKYIMLDVCFRKMKPISLSFSLSLSLSRSLNNNK